MEKFKPVAQATLKIGEKFLLVIVGTGALGLSVIDARFENIKLMVQVMGAVCFAFGFVPMFWSFVKASWPKGK